MPARSRASGKGSSARCIGLVTPEAPREITLKGDLSPAAPQTDDFIAGGPAERHPGTLGKGKRKLWDLKMLALSKCPDDVTGLDTEDRPGVYCEVAMDCTSTRNRASAGLQPNPWTSLAADRTMINTVSVGFGSGETLLV
jgi:hypothetical protein